MSKAINMDKKSHWEGVYATKQNHEVSWYEPDPRMSIELIRSVAPQPVRVIDIGAGQSHLFERLPAEGHTITVLDISAAAIQATQNRMGSNAAKVHWIEGDITTLTDIGTFDVWHDRAVFHFLTDATDRQTYVEQVRRAVRPGGHVVVATFAEDGPEYCSGLPVVRYSAAGLHSEFGADFQLIGSEHEDHRTPRGAEQSFLYCLCRRE